MAEQAQKRAGAFSRFVLWLLVLCLMGVVWWLASERNARRYGIGVERGALAVSKGRFFPFGLAKIRADDPKLGRVYGPIPLPPAAKAPPEEEYEDQTALDRALFDLLAPWAREGLAKGDAASVSAASGLVERASALPGLTPEQHAQLGTLRGELAFSAAKAELKQAAQLVLSARRKLEAAREGGGENALAAGPLAAEVAIVSEVLAQEAEGKPARDPRLQRPEAVPGKAPTPSTSPNTNPTPTPNRTPTANKTPTSTPTPTPTANPNSTPTQNPTADATATPNPNATARPKANRPAATTPKRDAGSAPPPPATPSRP